MHLYPIRNLDNFYIQKTICHKVRKTPLIDLQSTWNSIDESLKCTVSENALKNEIKTELMSKHADFHYDETVCISCMNLLLKHPIAHGIRHNKLYLKCITVQHEEGEKKKKGKRRRKILVV